MYRRSSATSVQLGIRSYYLSPCPLFSPFGLRHLLQVGGSRYNGGNLRKALPWEPRSFFKRGNLANELLFAQRSGLPSPHFPISPSAHADIL